MTHKSNNIECIFNILYISPITLSGFFNVLITIVSMLLCYLTEPSATRYTQKYNFINQLVCGLSAAEWSSDFNVRSKGRLGNPEPALNIIRIIS